MDKIRQNIIYIEKDWGFFFGRFDNNLKHKHYAIQLSIPIQDTITVKALEQSFNESEALLIQSNVEHRVLSSQAHLLCLFSPISTIGQKIILHDPITSFSNPIIDDLKKQVIRFIHKEISITTFKQKVQFSFNNFHAKIASHDTALDQRIIDALAYLKDNNNRVVPLSEIAKIGYLSQSRFIHLFKEQLGITYRRAQLWNKISASFPYLKNHSITETAYAFGFTDSAHYSKTFKENFGFSPKQLLKISQFIQV